MFAGAVCQNQFRPENIVFQSDLEIVHGQDFFAEFFRKTQTGRAEHFPQISFVAVDSGLVELPFDGFR